MPLRPELKEAMDVNWDRSKEAYRYLAEKEKGVPTDPTHPFVTTTAALPREGEEARESRKPTKGTAWQAKLITDLRAELVKRDEELAKAKVIDAALRTESQRRMQEIGSLRAELAKRDAEIAVRIRDRDHLKVETADLEAKARNLHANLADRDRELVDCKKRSPTIDALRVQLARAAAIEEKARAAWEEFRVPDNDGPIVTAMRKLRDSFAAHSPSVFAKPVQCRCGETAVRVDTRACARCGLPAGGFSFSPHSPQLLRLLGAVGSALADHRSGHGIGRVAEELREAAEGCKSEGIRLAVLERVAVDAKDYIHGEEDPGRYQIYHRLRLSVADLDKLEVTT